MRTVRCTCTNCNRTFEKPRFEYNRAVKTNKSFFCSRTCAGKYNRQNLRKGGRSTNKRKSGYANPFLYYLRSCRRRDPNMNLSVEYLARIWEEQQGICPYSGIKLILNSHTRRNKDHRFTASLDRIDSSKGYIEGNVQFVSTLINFMKHTMSHEDTIEFLHLISKNYCTGFPVDQTISSSY